ncbi:sensor histidine kinase [Arenicella xantha]|uniref:histidine kinase n=1 Tax=Arenicella xantha TaxID=644221 RepID=A0A395JQ25_9GAMM|nr:HAMP domain-containing sensor histidine kinase [Arenicella xantha]RBP50810.1 signal transduction histidine kinase [Arenicella xantha]
MHGDIRQSIIRSKLSRKMTLQACLIALVAVLGIGFASVVIEQFLVKQALTGESRHFWETYNVDPSFPPPNTDNLKGYLTVANSQEGVPEELKGYGLGFHKMHGQTAHSLLYTSEHDGKRLHLLFDGESVLRLALFFGIFPLTICLVLIYVAAWWVYRESNHLLSPIVWLANKFDRFDPAHASASLKDLSDIPGDVDWEVEKLVTSFSSYSRRIQRFVQRERAFTRDASHEFRTPLTVIKMASDLLLAEQDLDAYSKKFVTRIKGAARDMEELIDAFLILARETDKEFEDEHTVIADIVEREIRDAEIYLDDKPITIEVDEQFPLQLNTARKVVSIVLGNLIRNAVLYTNEGTVKVTIKEHSVVIEDTGIGMTEEQTKKIFQPYYRADQVGKTERKGYGVGLTIVKRLSNRFNWIVEVESEVNVGTKIECIFDESSRPNFLKKRRNKR